MNITVDYHQTNQKTNTGKTLKPWPIIVDHYITIEGIGIAGSIKAFQLTRTTTTNTVFERGSINDNHKSP
ncbi:hypothetical protein AB7X21_15390, partial [Providencia rettgeri]